MRNGKRDEHLRTQVTVTEKRTKNAVSQLGLANLRVVRARLGQRTRTWAKMKHFKKS